MSHLITIISQSQPTQHPIATQESAELPTDCMPQERLSALLGSLEPLVLEETWYFTKPENKN